MKSSIIWTSSSSRVKLIWLPLEVQDPMMSLQIWVSNGQLVISMVQKAFKWAGGTYEKTQCGNINNFLPLRFYVKFREIISKINRNVIKINFTVFFFVKSNEMNANIWQNFREIYLKHQMHWIFQCGNWGNSLSHFFEKIFVKAMVLLKVDFTKYFFSQGQFPLFTQCNCESGNHWAFLPQWSCKNSVKSIFHTIKLHSKLIWRKKVCGSEFRIFLHCENWTHYWWRYFFRQIDYSIKNMPFSVFLRL